MMFRIMKRIKRKSRIRIRTYFAGLPTSYSRDEFLLKSPRSIASMIERALVRREH
jgi:hypothetical protein